MDPVPTESDKLQQLNARSAILRDHRRRLMVELSEVEDDLEQIECEVNQILINRKSTDHVS